MVRLLWSAALVLAAVPAAAKVSDPASLVDPFVGTQGDHGQLTPAATGPYGMVQLVADTMPAQHAGYDFAAHQLVGFSHTRAVGVGCGGGGGDLLVAVGYRGDAPRWTIDKASERAQPGWYHVRYGEGIVVDLAAVGAAGESRFIMPHGGVARVVLDPRHGYTRRHEAEWVNRSAADLTGRMAAGTVCDRGVYHLSFAARLTVNGKPVSVAAAPLPGDRLAFDVPIKAGDRIALVTGLSVVDPSSAAQVRDTVIGTRSIEQVRAIAHDAWNKALGRVRVSEDGERARLLYTSLFRAMQVPVRIDDTAGRYRRIDGSLHTAPAGHHRYSGWAVWDNYRTQLPLIALLDPRSATDIAASLAELYIAGKAQWATPNEPFITVRTEHAGVALLDFARKGIGGFDARRVLPLMAAELPNLPRSAPDEQLEAAYDAWAVAELAHDVGDTASESRYRREALSYRAMWAKVFRNVGADFDTVKARGLYQGTLWQYRWAPIFDLDWLIGEALGRDRFNRELNRFFLDDLFNMTNQPDIQTPWLFELSGEPQRTQALVDTILHRRIDHWYANDGKRSSPWHGYSFALDPVGFADGMDDDEGCMSSWYVWGSLGLYPLVPGKPYYAVTAPSFARSTIALPGGRRVTIERQGPVNGAIDHIEWNGERLPGFTIDHRRLVRGGRLTVVLR